MVKQIQISHCNNIDNANIAIQESKLNIFYGRNGTGKSSIAKAILLSSELKSLNDLTPYQRNTPENQPSVTGCDFNKVLVFNEETVNQYIFQKDSVIKNAFNIFIRTPEYDSTRNFIDSTLQDIKRYFTDNENIIKLRDNIEKLIKEIKINKSGTLLGNIKKVAEGKGAYFKLSEKLANLNEFCTEDIVSDWADWRLKGNEKFGNKGKCPYCSTQDTEQTIELNTAFNESFTKGSVETAQAIKNALEALNGYIDPQKASRILQLFGIKEQSSNFSELIKKLATEANILKERLDNIISFNSFSVNYEDISNLETKLNEMKIDLDLNLFFITDTFKKEMSCINTEIDRLLNRVNDLKTAIAKSKKLIKISTEKREKDINQFLKLAGFNYNFEITTTADGESRAILKFILPDGNMSEEILAPKDHLSWGERNAFSLVMFMFFAVSENADLIVLDDPISSFDGTKKYAIMHRLFQTGSNTKSFSGKTVLLLTHNFEPIIDYIQVPSGEFKGNADSRCATYIENKRGNILCIPIDKNSIILTHLMWKELSQDDTINPIVRVAALRKYIEYQEKDISSNMAYHILSSLIHGRPIPTTRDNKELCDQDIIAGTQQIKEFINDFEYAMYLRFFDENELKRQYISEQNYYYKIIIFRAFTEQKPELRKSLADRDVVRKYVDETFHIENDYIYTLDVRKFDIIPADCIEAINTLFETN